MPLWGGIFKYKRKQTMTTQRILALDCDGVLLDYSLAYASAWERAFGVFPRERDPRAYWPIDRWEVDRLSGERLEQLRAAFDENFWATIPAIEGAVEACHILKGEGYTLVCVTALPDRFAVARKSNLSSLGFPIETVIATDNAGKDRSPKADALHALKPVAFVDDYLPYMVGIQTSIHRALIQRAVNGSPNTGEHLQSVSSTHSSLLNFARWWIDKGKQK